MNYIITVRAS